MKNGGGRPPVLGCSFVVYRREERGRAKHRQLLNRCTQEEATAASGSKWAEEGGVCVQVLQGRLRVCVLVCTRMCAHTCSCVPTGRNEDDIGYCFSGTIQTFFLFYFYWPGTLQVAQAGFSRSGFKGKHCSSTLMWVLGSYSGSQTYTASTLFSPGALKWINLRQLRTFCLPWVPGRSPWGQRWWQHVFVGCHVYSHTLPSLFLLVILGVV